MDEAERLQLEDQASKIRLELKTWESKWAKSHQGQKPTASDIKSNPGIASKYKEYNRVRGVLAGKIPPKNKRVPKRKRAADDLPDADTPAKRTMATPSISRKLFSPAMPTSIGPTPQRDGRVLGLFDLLANTPSKSTGAEGGVGDDGNKRPLGTAQGNAQATPRKQTSWSPTCVRGRRHSRTPMSGAKRALLDEFLDAPSIVGTAADRGTPTSLSNLQFATPAFLRRYGAPQSGMLSSLAEDGAEWKVSPLRLPRKPPIRGLSSLLASLRKQEEEKAEDELDALREIEAEAEGARGPAEPLGRDVVPKKTDTAASDQPPKDSQAAPPERPVLLGGFDDEALFDSTDEEELGRDGKPLRVFKKKGQKRTTRRVNMRPTRVARPAEDADSETAAEPAENSGAGTDDEGQEKKKADGKSKATSGQGVADKEEKNKKKTKKNEKNKNKKHDEKEGPVKKVVRKVQAAAHQNFKRLKLRNSGSKGGKAGFNSRYRKRR